MSLYKQASIFLVQKDAVLQKAFFGHLGQAAEILEN